MKKKILQKAVFLSLCFFVCALFFSCTMFTTSLGTKFQRNQQSFLKDASAGELLAFSQGANASNPETVKAVLNLLSGKSPEELKELPIGSKEDALNLTLDATLPMKKISEIAGEAENLTVGSSNPGQAEKLLKKLLDETDTFDTKASVQLLSDRDAMKKAKPDVLANAAVALIVQVAAKNGYDKIKDNITNSGGQVNFKDDPADTIVDKMLGTGSSAIGTPEDKKALTAAVNAAKLLSGAENVKDSEGHGVSRPDIDPKNVKLLGLVPLGDILGSFN